MMNEARASTTKIGVLSSSPLTNISALPIEASHPGIVRRLFVYTCPCLRFANAHAAVTASSSSLETCHSGESMGKVAQRPKTRKRKGPLSEEVLLEQINNWVEAQKVRLKEQFGANTTEYNDGLKEIHSCDLRTNKKRVYGHTAKYLDLYKVLGIAGPSTIHLHIEFLQLCRLKVDTFVQATGRRFKKMGWCKYTRNKKNEIAGPLRWSIEGDLAVEDNYAQTSSETEIDWEEFTASTGTGTHNHVAEDSSSENRTIEGFSDNVNRTLSLDAYSYIDLNPNARDPSVDHQLNFSTPEHIVQIPPFASLPYSRMLEERLSGETSGI
ncbi:hypothetical protein VTL71DRAFT_9118 [Oculimacula yallundae]|uniref:Uncharacterized protein n=1 Tax=Oculimacula yallundae TaxID=86028 RepID=A0ABR4BVD2_9HELO